MALPLAHGFARISMAILSLLGASACSRAPRADPPATAAPPPAIASLSAVSPAQPAASFDREVKGHAFRLVFHAAPLPNLVYQLDCMAGRHPCSRAAYQALWSEELGWTEEDDRLLADFRDLRDRYQGRMEPRATSSLAPAPLPLPRTDQQMPVKLAIAGLLARTPEEHVAELGLLTSMADARRVQSIVDHFRPRFDAYWATRGRALCERSAEALAGVFERDDLEAYIERVAHFYEADLPEGTVLDFHLVARPPHPSVNAARQLGSHAVVEVLEDKSPEERAPTVVHELFHYFYASASDDRLASLTSRFVGTDDALAVPSHALLDEALATALGTAATQRRLDPEGFARALARPGGLYQESTIDRVAKAVLPVVEARMSRGETLHGPHFVNEWLDAVHGAYPDGLPPVAHVRPLVAALEPAFWGAFQTLAGVSLASTLGGATATDRLDAPETLNMFKERALWGGAFFVTPASIGRLSRYTKMLGEATLAAIQAEAKNGVPFVYATCRGPGVYRFVFVAPDAPAMDRLVRGFVRAPVLVEGIYEDVLPIKVARQVN